MLCCYAKRAQQRWVEEKVHVRVPRWFLRMCGIVLTIFLVGHWVGSLQFMVAKFADFPNGSWTSALAGEAAMTQYWWSVFKTLYMLVGGEDVQRTLAGENGRLVRLQNEAKQHVEDCE